MQDLAGDLHVLLLLGCVPRLPESLLGVLLLVWQLPLLLPLRLSVVALLRGVCGACAVFRYDRAHVDLAVLSEVSIGFGGMPCKGFHKPLLEALSQLGHSFSVPGLLLLLSFCDELLCYLRLVLLRAYLRVGEGRPPAVHCCSH